MKIILQVDREDCTRIVLEEQYNFIRTVLTQIDLPVEECLPESMEEFEINNKIALRQILARFKISIQESFNGKIEIYLNQDLIAYWNRPEIILRQELDQADPTKQLYLDLVLDFWSVFDEKA